MSGAAAGLMKVAALRAGECRAGEGGADHGETRKSVAGGQAPEAGAGAAREAGSVASSAPTGSEAGSSAAITPASAATATTPARLIPPLAVSLVTLGVADLFRAIAFYEALGLERRVRQAEGVAFFACGTVVLSLYPRHELATDAGMVAGRAGQFGGVVLACNRASRAEVDSTLIRAVAAGGRALRPAQATFWGGYAGYVADPDGHPWEIAHNPGFPLGPEGRLSLPE